MKAPRYFAVCCNIVLIMHFNSISYANQHSGIKNQNSYSWTFECQRNELAPLWYVDSSITYNKLPTLALEGGGKEVANGCWYTMMAVDPNAWYEFRAYFKAEEVEELFRSILARILWYDESGEQVGRAEYPATTKIVTAGNWNLIGQNYQIPAEAIQARIELVYRWDADGKVNFGGVSLEKTEDPGSRLVRLAAIHHQPENSSGPRENLQQFTKLIERAAEQEADIVCLPEGVTLVGTGLDYVSASEPIPGPTTEFLGQVAKKHNLYIVAGILEKDEGTVYNTAILVDRNGHVAGKYRKVSLPREEIEGGVTPGNAFPVFDTDFGKIGMMICWDVTFPEAARTLAFNGAEVIFLPIWGGHLILAKARALENQVYLVSSTYNMKTAVFDLEGEIIGEATEENPVVVIEVDLNQRKFWPWLGDLKNRIRREMPSEKSQKVTID